MKMILKLLGLLSLVGGAVAAAVAIDRRRRLPAPGAGVRPADRTGVAPDVVIVEAEIIGLEVDLPVRGKNVP